jgi:hypothetical protein
MAETRRVSKSRRRPAEKALADTILAESKKHAPDLEAAAQAKRYVDATMASRRFDSHNRTPEGFTIHRFHREEETLTGVLGECNGQSGYGESTYPIVQDDGSVICVPGNRRLVRAFRKGKFTFQRIRITYKGKLRTAGGHHEKVFLVEPAPLGKDGVGPAGRDLIARAAADAKAGKGK